MMDSKTWIDVVDTGVKIGLGALVGGFTGIWLAKLNNKNNAKMYRLKRRRKIIEDILERIDEFSSSTTTYWANFRNILFKKNNNKTIENFELEELKLQEKLLFNNFTIVNTCKSRLLLIGAEDAEKKLAKYRDLISELYRIAYLENEDCSLEELDGYSKSISIARRNFFKSLSIEYDKS